MLLAQGAADRHLYSAVVLVDVTPRMELGGVARIVDFMAANPGGFATLDDAAAAISAYNPHRSKPPGQRRAGAGAARGGRRPLALALGPRLHPWRSDGADPDLLAERMDALAVELYAAANEVAAPTLLVRGAQSDLATTPSPPPSSTSWSAAGPDPPRHPQRGEVPRPKAAPAQRIDRRIGPHRSSESASNRLYGPPAAPARL